MILALSAGAICWTERRRGRVAEGTSLLRMHTAYTCIVSSNLTVSARNKRKSHLRVAFFLFWAGTSGPSAWPTCEIRRAGRTSPSPLRIAHLLCATRTTPRAAGARPMHTTTKLAQRAAPAAATTPKARATRGASFRTGPNKLAQRAAPAHSTKIRSGTGPP